MEEDGDSEMQAFNKRQREQRDAFIETRKKARHDKKQKLRSENEAAEKEADAAVNAVKNSDKSSSG